MYTLIEHSDNYSKSSGSLWQYCKDISAAENNDGEIVNFAVNNLNDSFDFKAKMAGETGDDGTKNIEIMVPVKCLINFWRTLEMSLINCEINFILLWSENCITVSTDVANQNAIFGICGTKLYVSVTLSAQDNSKLLQQLKSVFKRVISWNKYLSKPELLAQNPNLNHLVERSFQGVDKFFVLAFESDT